MLASTKDHAHRIYLRCAGIFAEVTLHYQKRAWRHHEWTFPDYRREDYQEFFTRARDLVRRDERQEAHAVTWLLVGAVLPSLVVSCLAGLWIRRRASDWGLVDHPSQRKVHTAPVPLGGGIAIWLGVVVPLALGQIALWILAAGGGNDSGSLGPFPLPDIVERNLAGLAQQAPSCGFCWAPARC